MQKDPFCGMKVDEKKTKLTSTHDNKTFYPLKELILQWIPIP